VIADTLRRFCAEYGIRGPLVVGVSGGGDSSALLVALAGLGDVELHAVHVNHKLRGSDSDEDESFVRDLCRELRVTLHVVPAPLDPEDVRHLGIEAAARKVRYAILKRIRVEVGATHIATAHHKNDQAETILMRLLTGSGIAGLRGIQPLRADGVIRPLLDLRRSELDAFLRARNITPRTDRSNTDSRFLRNRVREVLATFDPSVIDNLASIAAQARAQWAVLEHVITAADGSTITKNETRFGAWPEDPWLRRAILHRHIRRLDPDSRDVSAADLERLADSLDTLKRVSITARLELVRRGNAIILRRRALAQPPFEFALTPGERKSFPSGSIELRTANGERRGQLFQLPRDASASFIVRNRRDGDRFQPLGMQRQKKLKDFLIDRKIPAEVRDSIPLLVWNGSIVWVGGVEISEAFKVTDRAGQLYEVSIENEGQEEVQRESDREPHREAR
jgi:tRNA(Ile)-lysidine synthase